jgi:hypothetical protein
MKKGITSIYFLDEQFDKMPKEISHLAKENSYAYIFTKSALFLTVGAEKYRFDDYFHQPTEEMDIPLLISGCSQIVYKCRGLTAETCICDLPEPAFINLMLLFHFELIGEDYDDSVKGQVIMKGTFRHIVSDFRSILWCRIKG